MEISFINVNFPFKRTTSGPQKKSKPVLINQQMPSITSLFSLSKSSVSHSVVSNSSRSHGLQPARTLCPWNSLGKNTGVNSHSLLQEIFPIEGSNPSLLHCRQVLYRLCHSEEARRKGWDWNERRAQHGNTHTNIYKIDSRGNLLSDSGDSNQGSVTTWEVWDGVAGGREAQEGGNICIPMADLC